MLCAQIKSTSLCGLGAGAPNPVETILKHFRSEFEAHIYERKCPARVCKALISYVIMDGPCTGCTVCARNCPVNAITGERRNTHVIDPDTCIRCGICMQVCNFNAIEIH
jgi:ferredoxin